MATRTVTLELLRHGPSHNQLLSPLTPYLALCGNHDVETVHVGSEHVQMMRRMRGLRYQDGRPSELGALEDAAAEVSRLVGSVRSLTAELSSVPRGPGDIIHLRLILSASELALLPFELIRSPEGFPGPGQWLSLQTVAPIALTREVRRVSSAASVNLWPERPRILVVAASPRGVGPVPLRAHLLALHDAISAWLTAGVALPFRDERRDLERHLTLLPRATLVAVRDACARAAGEGHPYTHVHVLAHGVEANPAQDGERRFGLAFHADQDPDAMDIVSGTRLAAALRCHPKGPLGGIAGPAVVTLASCDSGDVGSVVALDASIAHQLHEAGVSLVLASQFPLSVRASSIMTELVYARLLRGDDPRPLVHDLRQALLVACPETHDWASVVAYAALPEDTEVLVKRTNRLRAQASLETALRHRDLLERAGASQDNTAASLRSAMAWLRTTLPREDDPSVAAERARALGVLATASKRVAEARYEGPLWPVLSAGASPGEEGGAAGAPVAADVAMFIAAMPAPDAFREQKEARGLLEESRRCYLEIVRCGIDAAWPVVQYLALSEALRPLASHPERARELQRWWTTAFTIAEDNLRSKRGREADWAHSALVELYVLAQLLPDDHWGRRDAGEEAFVHLDALLSSAAELDKYSLLRQLLRYCDGWWKGDELARLPRRLCDRMLEEGVDPTHVDDA